MLSLLFVYHNLLWKARKIIFCPSFSIFQRAMKTMKKKTPIPSYYLVVCSFLLLLLVATISIEKHGVHAGLASRLKRRNKRRAQARAARGAVQQVPLQEGDGIPQDVTFWTIMSEEEGDDENDTDDNELQLMTVTTSGEYFSSANDDDEQERVVLFAIPGIYDSYSSQSSSCNTMHVRGYERLYQDILKAGVDEVYCKCEV